MRHFRIVAAIALAIMSSASLAQVPALDQAGYQSFGADVNGDGLQDVLLKPAPSIVMIPLDDDLMVPIPIPSKSPTLLLLSNATNGTYTLNANPSPSIVNSPLWQAGTHDLVFGNVLGNGTVAMVVRARTPGKASFLITSSATGTPQLLEQLTVARLGIDLGAANTSVELSDKNGDGRADLVVKVNGAITKTFFAAANGTFDFGGGRVQVTAAAELLWTDVASEVQAVNVGVQGDIWVANVDMTRLPQVTLRATQPYWFKYLRSFWTSNGTYVGSACEAMLPAIGDPQTMAYTYPYLIQAVDVNGVKIGTLHYGGPQGQITSHQEPPISTTPWISPPTTAFQTGPFYCIYTLKSWTINVNTSGYAYVRRVIRRKVGEGIGGSTWYPLYAAGAAFSQLGTQFDSRVYGSPSVWLNKKIPISSAVPPGTPTIFNWDVVDPGGVSSDGWGVVPTDISVTNNTSTQPRWIYVKPKNTSISVRWTSCSIPFPICSDSVGPIQLVDGGPRYFYRQSVLQGFLAFNELRVFDTGSWAAGVAALAGPLDEVVSFGNSDSITQSDFAAQGWYYLLADGQGGASRSLQLTQDMVQIIRAGPTNIGDRTVFVNGSGNNLDSALANATATMNAYGLPSMLLLYVPQPAALQGSNGFINTTANNLNAPAQTALANLLAFAYAQDAPGFTNVISHSWGGQVVARAIVEGGSTDATNWVAINTANIPPGDTYLTQALLRFQGTGTVQYGVAALDTLLGLPTAGRAATGLPNINRNVFTPLLVGAHDLQGVLANNGMRATLPLR